MNRLLLFAVFSLGLFMAAVVGVGVYAYKHPDIPLEPVEYWLTKCQLGYPDMEPVPCDGTLAVAALPARPPEGWRCIAHHEEPLPAELYVDDRGGYGIYYNVRPRWMPIVRAGIGEGDNLQYVVAFGPSSGFIEFRSEENDPQISIAFQDAYYAGGSPRADRVVLNVTQWNAQGVYEPASGPWYHWYVERGQDHAYGGGDPIALRQGIARTVTRFHEVVGDAAITINVTGSFAWGGTISELQRASQRNPIIPGMPPLLGPGHPCETTPPPLAHVATRPSTNTSQISVTGAPA